MSINRSQFNQQVAEFVKKCQAIGENWIILSDKWVEVDADCLRPHDIVALTKREISSLNRPCKIVTYEYSVIYSESYEVPVMYYNASLEDGSLEIIDTEKFKGAVSQVEHPLYFRPFYMVHPCNTKELMTDRSDYLMCWLTTVGTLINLKFNPKLACYS